MEIPMPGRPLPLKDRGAPSSESRQEKRVRRFTRGITVLLIVVCNGALLLGLWASEVDLDRIFSGRDLYDPSQAYCVRVAWAKVTGAERPVRLCAEWLDQSDPSGKTHTLRADETIMIGADGKLHYENEMTAAYRLIGLLVFMTLVLFCGMRAKRYLVARYRTRMQASQEGSS